MMKILSRRSRKLLTILAVGGGVIVIAHELELHLPDIEHWLETLGVWAPLAFVGLFTLSTPFFVSVDALCMAAGLLFPLKYGVFYMILATYLAATLIFVLGRYFFRQKVVNLLTKHKRFAGVEAALDNQAFRLMLLLRLTPLPFALLSYTFAVARVGFMSYLIATSGILIYNITLVYIGYTTKHIAGIVSGSSGQTTISYPLLMLGLALTVGVLLYVSKLAGKMLKDMKVVEDGSESGR